MYSFVNGHYFKIGGNYKPPSSNIENFFSETTNTGEEQDTISAEYLSNQRNKNIYSSVEEELNFMKHDEEINMVLDKFQSIVDESSIDSTIMPKAMPITKIPEKITIDPPNFSESISNSIKDNKMFLSNNKTEVEDLLMKSQEQRTVQEEENKIRRLQREKQDKILEEERKQARQESLEMKNKLLDEYQEQSEKLIQENIIKEERIRREISQEILKVKQTDEERSHMMKEQISQEILKVKQTDEERNEMMKKQISQEIYETRDQLHTTMEEGSQNYQGVIKKIQEEIKNFSS